jgi:hypothetical protein
MSYQPIGSVYRFKMPHEQNKVERGYVLSFFLFVSICTGVSASLCIIVQVATVLLRDYGEDGVTLDVMLHWIVQFYEILMCLGIIIIEMEMTDVLGSITLLQSWTTRGMMYIFAALLTLEERNNIESTLETCVLLAGSCLLASGFTYFIMVRGGCRVGVSLHSNNTCVGTPSLMALL